MNGRRVAVVATAVGAAAVLGVGLALPAGAVARGAGWSSGCPGTRTGAWGDDDRGQGTGRGMGAGMGTAAGMRIGSRDDRSSGTHAAFPSGDLTSAQEGGLVTMVQEETLAHDLYTAFGARYDDPVFDRVAASEARHVEAVRALLDAYGLEDPTLDAAPGDLADPALAAMYDDLLARGETSVDEAYAVAREVERDDIARIAQAAAGVTAADVTHVYAMLTAASERHLAVFGADA